MNAHDAILSAVLTALRLPTPVTTGSIEEEIDAADMPEGQTEAISVALVVSVPRAVAINGAPVDWVTDLAIDCAARTDGRTAAGRASRALHAAVYARLMADTTLGGAASYIGEPQISQDQALLGTRIGRTSGLYTVHHRTAAGTLEATA
jgi:hypothetical protein